LDEERVALRSVSMMFFIHRLKEVIMLLVCCLKISIHLVHYHGRIWVRLGQNVLAGCAVTLSKSLEG
jgi:hypothetical protein